MHEGPIDWLPDESKVPRPRGLKGAGEIVGGLWDTRHPAQWRPEDAQAPTAYGSGGKPMRSRFQCCRIRSREAGGGRCCQAIRAGPDGQPVGEACNRHGATQRALAAKPVGAGDGVTVGGVHRWRFRQFLEGDLSDRYTALADRIDVMLDPTEHMALMDLRIQELLRRAQLGDTQGFRQDALDLHQELLNAMTPADGSKAEPREVRKAVARLGEHLQLGTSSDACMREVTELADRRLQRSEQTRKALAAQQDTLTRARVVALLGEFVQVLQGQLDARTLEVVLGELDRRVLANGPLSMTPEPEPEPAAA